MPIRRRLLALAPTLLAAWLSVAPARAAEDGAPTTTLRQEIAGLELAPISVGSERSNLGFGAALRIGRHRWPDFYWTPVQAAFYAGGEGFDKTILLKVQTEPGAIFHTAAGTLELGLGVGAGFLMMETKPYGCDGTCGVGGLGLMLSPVVRYLIRDRASHAVGIFVRAEVPTDSTEDDASSSIEGFGMTCLFGLDLAGGWG